MISYYLSTLLLPSLTSASCYWPDGSIADQEYPCVPNATASACCPETWTCLTNGICAAAPNASEVVTYGRHSCTDQSWDSPDCPAFCEQVIPWGGAIVYWCPSQNSWCCDSGLDYMGCCATTKIAGLGPATALTMIEAPTTSVTSSLATTTSSSSSSPSSRTPTKPASSASATAAAAVTSAAAIVSSSSNHAVAIGVGVGVPIGVILIAALLFVMWRSNKKSKALNARLEQQEHTTQTLLRERDEKAAVVVPGRSEVPGYQQQRQQYGELQAYPEHHEMDGQRKG